MPEQSAKPTSLSRGFAEMALRVLALLTVMAALLTRASKAQRERLPRLWFPKDKATSGVRLLARQHCFKPAADDYVRCDAHGGRVEPLAEDPSLPITSAVSPWPVANGSSACACLARLSSCPPCRAWGLAQGAAIDASSDSSSMTAVRKWDHRRTIHWADDWLRRVRASKTPQSGERRSCRSGAEVRGRCPRSGIGRVIGPRSLAIAPLRKGQFPRRRTYPRGLGIRKSFLASREVLGGLVGRAQWLSNGRASCVPAVWMVFGSASG